MLEFTPAFISKGKRMFNKECAVIGAGIMGLRTAVLIAQKGASVKIFTAHDPLKTTSIAAGAIWMPYQVFPEVKALQWAKRSLMHYQELAQNDETGVRFRNHTEFFDKEVARPSWMNLVEPGDPYDCKAPSNAVCSHSAKIPVIDTYQCILYHLRLLEQLKVEIVFRAIPTFQALSDFRCIINATGAGSGHLASDSKVYPIKGQTFVVSQPSVPITQSLFYQTEALKTLIIPHAEKVVVGITYDPHDTSLNYDTAKEKELLQSACSFYPALSGSQILARRVGHRPGRDEVRLERETTSSGQTIIHNYGHGGAGIALAPACAEESVQLFEDSCIESPGERR